MKAFRLHDFTDLNDLKLGEEETPCPQRGEVLVRVHAVSLNYRDIAMLRRRYPLPHRKGLIPTSDGAQLAKAAGAFVVATTSSESKAKRLRHLGTDQVVNYKVETQWGDHVRALNGGRGVDRVVEVGGPGTMSESLSAVAPGGEIACIGFLSSESRSIDFNNPEGILFGGKGTEDLFLHLTSNYKFCGFDILPDFGVFDIFKDPDIPTALEDYKRHLVKHCL